VVDGFTGRGLDVMDSVVQTSRDRRGEELHPSRTRFSVELIMPVLSNAAVVVTGRLGDLCRHLESLRAEIGDDALVVTEVGLNGDAYVGSKAQSVRAEYGIVTISADRERDLVNEAKR
jgi:hypothetical protein